MMRAACLIAACLLAVPALAAPRTYQSRGMVPTVDLSHRTFVVSHDAIEGLTDAMAMPFEMKGPAELAPVVPGAIVEFPLTVGERAGYASNVRVRRYETVQQDPLAAHRLALLNQAAGRRRHVLAVGETALGFTLIDQARRPKRLSGPAGTVVALNFI